MWVEILFTVELFYPHRVSEAHLAMGQLLKFFQSSGHGSFINLEDTTGTARLVSKVVQRQRFRVGSTAEPVAESSIHQDGVRQLESWLGQFRAIVPSERETLTLALSDGRGAHARPARRRGAGEAAGRAC